MFAGRSVARGGGREKLLRGLRLQWWSGGSAVRLCEEFSRLIRATLSWAVCWWIFRDRKTGGVAGWEGQWVVCASICNLDLGGPQAGQLFFTSAFQSFFHSSQPPHFASTFLSILFFAPALPCANRPFLVHRKSAAVLQVFPTLQMMIITFTFFLVPLILELHGSMH